MSKENVNNTVIMFDGEYACSSMKEALLNKDGMMNRPIQKYNYFITILSYCF